MWPADREGQLHTVKTRHVHAGVGDSLSTKGSGSPSELSLTLQVVSTAPKVFAIKNFLSAAEADELVELGKGQLSDSVVGSATTGGTVSDKVQRSSSTAWLEPDASPLLKTIYKRAADVMQVKPESMAQWTEPMQLVHYAREQHYSAHYDFEVTTNVPQSRFATLLLYLNDQASETAGGETAFPVAAREDGSCGFKIHGGKGGAVLFYSLLEDGNCDVASLHSALPVKQGEKWAANIWLWG
jgi:prolyl 4-hydroxylase